MIYCVNVFACFGCAGRAKGLPFPNRWLESIRNGRSEIAFAAEPSFPFWLMTGVKLLIDPSHLQPYRPSICCIQCINPSSIRLSWFTIKIISNIIRFHFFVPGRAPVVLTLCFCSRFFFHWIPRHGRYAFPRSPFDCRVEPQRFALMHRGPGNSTALMLLRPLSFTPP